MTKREQIIQDLRHALYVAESPHNDVVEFEIDGVGYCYEEPDEELPEGTE